jgi:acetyl esterase/lipase
MQLHALLSTALLIATTALAADLRYPNHRELTTYIDDQGVHHPILTSADWQHRRSDILLGMQQAMGLLPDRSHLPPLDVKITETVKSDNYTRLKITFVSEITTAGAQDRIPAYLFLPTTPSSEKRPAVLSLHPTSKLGKAEITGQGQPNRQYALELAEHGYVVLAPDYPSFGDYPCDFKDPRYASGTMKGIFNHMRCVDLLQSLKEVDPERIAVIGHSLGGHNALFLAAFDTRVKAVVTSCGWTPFADYYSGNLTGWTSPRYMPRLRDIYHLDPHRVPFDFQEVLAAIAPRPLFSNSPLNDDNFAVTGVQKAIPEIQKIYTLLGAKTALVVRHPNCAHDFPPDVRDGAYKFIDDVLKPTK